MLKNKSSIEVKFESKEVGDRFDISIDFNVIREGSKRPVTSEFRFPDTKEENNNLLTKNLLDSLRNISDEADGMMETKNNKTSLDILVTDLSYEQVLDAESEMIRFLLSLNDMGRASLMGYES